MREILERKQVNGVRAMLWQWTVNVMGSKVESLKAAAKMIRKPLEGIVARNRTRHSNGCIEAINGLRHAAQRKALGCGSFFTIPAVIFLLAGKLDFWKLNQHVA